ncbi:MAG: UDP-N-acetylglucosamine--N-acetylmuramyl-(pentapeptide) pyrophosphoryl-undecaprenol N-acetylglucosamine transferase [Verrucomicrobiota bacterium]|nr:UDP-N-acetylglucosamine--N-acetylmuramyl-(pentapeptide) pyrophosphoryl-undecaprenol N-acetylglucosamine transferase [Verrucomicrobiota bacterium]
MAESKKPLVSIACGGTGGHFFPGVAVARELQRQGARVSLWVSSKAIDQKAAMTVPDLDHHQLPAVGYNWRRPWRFILGMRTAMRTVRDQMKFDKPRAVLAMGGFTAAAPILEGRKLGAKTFLHESNAVAGRANRFLSRWVDEVFVGFDQAKKSFRCKTLLDTGTPVRQKFREMKIEESRRRLGFELDKPLVLILGGSQGARGVNRLVTEALQGMHDLQVLHLSGAQDLDNVRDAYEERQSPSQVHSFFSDMPCAVGAATLSITRAGASSLAELAAAGVPSIIIPLPGSMDQHQLANAAAVVESGGGVLIEERQTSPEELASIISGIITDGRRCEAMSLSMRQLDRPEAAVVMAKRIMELM